MQYEKKRGPRPENPYNTWGPRFFIETSEELYSWVKNIARENNTTIKAVIEGSLRLAKSQGYAPEKKIPKKVTRAKEILTKYKAIEDELNESSTDEL